MIWRRHGAERLAEGDAFVEIEDMAAMWGCNFVFKIGCWERNTRDWRRVGDVYD